MFILKGSAAARVIPFAVYILFLAVDQPLSDVLMGAGFDVRWLYAFRAGCVALLLMLLWRSYAELSWPVAMQAHAWLVSLFAGMAVFILWILPYPDWATLSGGGGGFDPTRPGDGGIDPVLVAIRISGAALVVPLMEELFWRSCIMRWLDRQDFTGLDPARVSWRAFAITAVLFAFEHTLWLAGLLAGAAFGWLYVKYRNLWAPIVAHAVTNGMLGFWVVQTGAWKYW